MSAENNLLKETDKYIKDYSDKKEIEQGVLNILEHLDGLKEKRNRILNSINRAIDDNRKNFNERKLFFFLYHLAEGTIEEKSNKLIEYSRLLENPNIPSGEKEKWEEKRKEMSDKIVNIYGTMNNILKNGDFKEIKNMILSIITLNGESTKEKDAFIYILKDINEEDGVDFDKIENFYEENKNLAKIDSFIEDVKRVIKSGEVEKEKTEEKDSPKKENGWDISI